jgi:hypothetical protein
MYVKMVLENLHPLCAVIAIAGITTRRPPLQLRFPIGSEGAAVFFTPC